MTGFARVEKEYGEGKLSGEARSLNSRYLEISIKLPRIDFFYEQKLRELVKKRVKRGKIDIIHEMGKNKRTDQHTEGQ